MKNLSSLAPFSLAGIIGMAYTSLAMAIQYFVGGYKLCIGDGPGGKFVAAGVLFGDGALAFLNPNSFILVCMLITAYMAHFNAQSSNLELKNNTIKRFNTVVSTSFGALILIMTAVTAWGFQTFDMASAGVGGHSDI